MAQQTTPRGRTPQTSRAPARPDEHSHGEVQDFLDRFARALTAGDTHTIAALWETPAYVLGDNDVHDVRSIDEVERFFAGARQQYNAQGITDTRAEIVKLDWPTERIVVVQVRWPYLDAAGRQLGAETSTYTLRRDGAGRLRLRVAVMHGVEETPQARH
jgi:hypothetical protein